MLSLQNWQQACRMPKYLQLAGFAVAACAPKAELLHLSTSLDKRFELPMLSQPGLPDILRLLRDACADFQPDYLMGCDDASVDVLNRFYRTVQRPANEADQRLRQLLIDSKGDPANYQRVRSKHLSHALARSLGIRTPDQKMCRDVDELMALARETAYPVVLKGEYGVAGLGVSICHGEGDLRAAWERAARAGSVALQAYVDGKVFLCNAAAYKGQLLASNVFEKVHVQGGPTGPSTVVRLARHPEMLEATRRFVEGTAYSGILSLDFMLTADNRAFFLECNPRPVPATHVGRAVGNDLFAALYAAMTGGAYDGAPVDGMTVALFPQEFHRDKASPHLWQAYHDVPWDEPQILRAFVQSFPP